MTIKINEYLSIMQAAKLLGVHPNTLRNWSKKNMIPVFYNPANNWAMYKKEDIQDFLDKIKG
jgi:MerR family transcriptional regulator, copper efflux regulator